MQLAKTGAQMSNHGPIVTVYPVPAIVQMGNGQTDEVGNDQEADVAQVGILYDRVILTTASRQNGQA